MKFIVDNQLPVALCHFINGKGSDGQHVLEVGLARAQDLVIWQQAIETDRVIVSKDEDSFWPAFPEVRGDWFGCGSETAGNRSCCGNLSAVGLMS